MKDSDYLGCAQLFAEAFDTCHSASNASAKLKECRINALVTAFQRTVHYLQHGIRSDLVLTSFAKKTALIQNALSISEIKEIMSGPHPQYYGGKFLPSPYDVPEEELIMWSMVSFRAPLNPAGFDRYRTLFREVIGNHLDPSEAEVM